MKQNPNTKMPEKVYKAYICTMTQSDTNAPTVNILHNDIGNIIWTREDIGYYLGTLAGAFTADKLLVLTNSGDSGACLVVSSIELAPDSIGVRSYDIWTEAMLADNMMFRTSIEIRVYS